MKPTGTPIHQEGEADSGLWTVPNLISALRIAAIPVFLWLLLGRDQPGASAVLLGFIAATDFLDGMVARKLGQVSEIGKLLDPLADRLLVFSSVVGGLLADLVPPWLGWPLIGREIAIGAVSLYLLWTIELRIEVRRLGKLATGLVFTAIPFYYLSGTGLMPDMWRWLGASVGAVGLTFYFIVTVQYLNDMRRQIGSRREPSTTS